jgi:phosphoribosylformylglycinamidine cyclo-ligase
LASSGLHTNGYSLARAALFPAYTVHQYIDELGMSLGEALLAVHISYAQTLLPLIQQGDIKGLSHITGGGIIGNTKRIVPQDLALSINWNSWERPAIYSMIQHAGNIPEEEMRKAFNLGIGMIIAVTPDKVEHILSSCSAYAPKVIGQLITKIA